MFAEALFAVAEYMITLQDKGRGERKLMCFSETANFVGSGVLATVGVLTLTRVKRRREPRRGRPALGKPVFDECCRSGSQSARARQPSRGKLRSVPVRKQYQPGFHDDGADAQTVTPSRPPDLKSALNGRR